MPPLQTKPRLPGLDTLRALAIILVFIFHCPYFTDQTIIGFFNQVGWVGVDLFFVLSGYLIGNQVLSRISNQKQVSLKTFYIRRFLRTFPNYYFILALYFLLPGFSERPIIVPLWQFLTFTQNFNLHQSGYSQSWSLCIEEQFYLFFPLIVLFFCIKRPLRQSWQMLIGLLIMGVIIRTIMWYVFVEPAIGKDIVTEYYNKIYYPTYTHLDGLLFGIAIALIKNFHPSFWQWLMEKGNILLITGITGSLISFYFLLNRFEMMQTAFGFSLVTFNFALLITAALSPSSLLYNVNIPGATTIAKLSYAIYLTHKQIILITYNILVERGVPYSFILYTAETIIMCLMSAWLLMFFIEKPFMWWRDKITRR
jgi:peptidoglycan/LPS O-acetylase OafA/YrhL